MFHTSRVHNFIRDVIHIGCIFQLSGTYSTLKCRHLRCVQNFIASLNWFCSYIHAMVLHLHYQLLAGMKCFFKWLDIHILIPLSGMSYSYSKRRQKKVYTVLPWSISAIVSDKVDSIWFLLFELSKSGSIVTYHPLFMFFVLFGILAW